MLPKLRHPERLGLHLRVVLRGGVVLGPGRAELLERIRDLGSIAAAGRAMGMSYRRAWGLIEETNGCFAEALVAADVGGVSGGGARLTEAGARVLAAYRAVERDAALAAAAQLALLDSLVTQAE